MNTNITKRLKSILHTFCGAFSCLWTPAIWFIRGISSLKVYRGGLVGSGKLVLLNGSVSSKNCTLHTNVAMMYPCKAILDHENSGCDTAASDRQAAPRAANYRQVFCSSKILHPLLSLDLLHSLHAAQRTQDSVHSSPKVKIQGTSLRDTVCQSGVEMSGPAVSKGIAGVLRCWGRLRTGLLHLVPGLWERWEAAPSSSMNCARGTQQQPDLGRPTQVILQARRRPPVANMRSAQNALQWLNPSTQDAVSVDESWSV